MFSGRVAVLFRKGRPPHLHCLTLARFFQSVCHRLTVGLTLTSQTFDGAEPRSRRDIQRDGPKRRGRAQAQTKELAVLTASRARPLTSSNPPRIHVCSMSRVLIPVQPDSSTPCVLADAAPPPLSPSILVDPPQPPSHNRAASIPPEIVAAIVNHAVERLVVEESIAPDFSPRVNAFLRSASLVHSEWRPIAQIALLRQGTVSLRSAQGYLGALRTRGVTHMVRCLRVQAEPRALPLGRWAWAGAGRLKPGKVDLLLDHLVPHLPALELIECVGCDPSDQTLVDGFPGASQCVRSAHEAYRPLPKQVW